MLEGPGLARAIVAASAAAWLTLAPPTTAESSNPEEFGRRLFVATVGAGPGRFAYVGGGSDDEWRGPESFAVSASSEFFILDAADREVEVFDVRGSHLRTVPLPRHHAYFDLDVQGDTLYLLAWDGVVTRIGLTPGSTEMVAAQELRVAIAGLFKTHDGHVALRWVDGSELLLDARDAPKRAGLQTSRENTDMLLFGPPLDAPLRVEYSVQPAGTYPLQRTPHGELMVLENDADLGADAYVETRIETFTNGRRSATVLAIPYKHVDGPRVPYQFLYANDEGRVYQMLLRRDGVELWELRRTQERRSLLPRTRPSRRSASLSHCPVPAGSVTCSMAGAPAHQRGLDMTVEKWTFHLKNLTPTTANTKPPEHLDGAADGSAQQGIAYCWGKMDGVDTATPGSAWSSFKDALAKDKYAGNTETVISPTTVGVDCSGFVCSAYKCSKKLSTRELAAPDSPFKPIAWNALQVGDIANDCGHHVWMYGGRIEAGGELKWYLTVESTTDTKEDRALQHRRQPSQVQQYVPMTRK